MRLLSSLLDTRRERKHVSDSFSRLSKTSDLVFCAELRFSVVSFPAAVGALGLVGASQ